MSDSQSSAAAARRFVVQHHVLHEGEHWDLMLEEGDVLLTWQLADPPEQAVGRAVPAVRIGNHRPAYLTYEGPVSDDRGEVHIVDRGTYECVTRSESTMRLVFHGRCLCGRYLLQQSGAHGPDWIMRPEPVGGPP